MTDAPRDTETDSELVDGISAVELRVCNLEESIEFYRDVVGLDVTDRSGERVGLGSPGGATILWLQSEGVTEPVDPGATGLFHVAIRVPGRTALGDALARVSDAGLRIGSADHLVSEALYIDDPDGHGLEIYRDRPRDEWPEPRDGNLVPMPTDPLDLRSLFDAGGGAEAIGAPCPPGTDVGHVHLQASDVGETADFYEGTLELDQTMELEQSAKFYSSNGYHHHVGANVWNSQGGEPAADDRAGLERVVLAAKNRDELDALGDRLERDEWSFELDGRDTIVTRDPDRIELRFAAP